MTKQTTSGAAPHQAADLARQWVTRAVLGIVRESGGQVVHRSVFRDRPDLNLRVTGAEPMAGLRAASALKMATRRLLLDYIRYAREDGHTWRNIGVGLGYSDDPPQALSRPGAHSPGHASTVTPRSSTAAQKPGTQPIAKMATPTAVPAWQPRSLRGTPRGMTWQTRDRRHQRGRRARRVPPSS